MRQKFWKQAGFTLIELLIVIAIIAVLLTLLVPALQQAKNQARIALCATNLRHVGFGLRSYSLEENNDKLPLNQRGNWLWDIAYTTTDLIMDYGGDPKTFYCPSDSTKSPEMFIMWNFGQAHLGSPYWDGNVTVATRVGTYPEPDDPAVRRDCFRVTSYFWLLDMDIPGGRPGQILGDPPREWLRQTTVPQPEDVEMVTDATLSNSDNPDSPSTTFTEVMGGSWSRWGIYDPTNHVRSEKPFGGNIAYVDGHVKWRHFPDMRVRYTEVGPFQWW
jgi:prepilin-type N-terminal cleavage/methylation domain-containing protein/prepilin-type processing-associated H-X9-DG protein